MELSGFLVIVVKGYFGRIKIFKIEAFLLEVSFKIWIWFKDVMFGLNFRIKSYKIGNLTTYYDNRSVGLWKLDIMDLMTFLGVSLNNIS